MGDLKKQMKKLKKQQKKLEKYIRLEQSTCPHVGKSGKSKLEEEFVDPVDGIRKARCRKCNDVIIVDPELIGDLKAIKTSADVVKTVLAELRSKVYLGRIKLDDSTMKLITTFDAEVLRELPELMETMMNVSGEGKKKKKKDKKKEKKRERWS